MRTGTDRKGFTLLELIIVMVLISLTVSFAAPKIQSGLYTDELSATAQRFVGLVTETALEARAGHTAFALRFQADTKTFFTAPVMTTGPETEGEEQAFLRAQLSDSVTLAGIEIQGDKTSAAAEETGIFFTPKGYTKKAAVHFEDDDGDQVTVILSPFLGVARILDSHVPLENDRMTVSR